MFFKDLAGIYTSPARNWKLVLTRLVCAAYVYALYRMYQVVSMRQLRQTLEKRDVETPLASTFGRNLSFSGISPFVASEIGGKQ